jgi:hypothetical protein
MTFTTRFLTLATLILVVVQSSGAQEPGCNLKASNLDAIAEFRGLKLGMTPVEVRAMVPVLLIPPPDEFGLSKTSFSPDFAESLDKSLFESIRTVSLEFIDGRLTSIWVGYKDSFKWQTVDSAIDGLTKELHLPNGWQPKARERQLVCADFRLAISSVSGGASIRLVDDVAKQVWQDRRTAKENQEP